MNATPPVPVAGPSDLRGAARLAADATAGLTDLVEAMHERIARLPGSGGPAVGGRTQGLTGLIYRTIRGATRLVGGSVEALLGLLEPALIPGREAALPSPQREAVVAALNGVLGDHLAASGNPLAITMALRRDGRALVLEREALRARLPDATGRVLVLLHGLCMNDLQWSRNGHDHGALLARERGCTPVYLHCNSGLHVSTNGRALSALLEQLVATWPVPVESLVLLGHSMGGLLARSALHQARQSGQAWPQRLTDLVFLGTPHHGAPLERAGHWVDLVLGATPYAAPFTRLSRLRSAGITDLRHGNVLDADWQDRETHAPGRDGRRPLPLPAGVRCYAVAATTGQQAGDLRDRLLGDGLVPLASALGRHKTAARTLAFARGRQRVVEGTNHMELLSSPAVAAQLLQWLKPAPSAAAGAGTIAG
jgi:pimeloyl-ACP methyl ester carboxylesterase